MGNFSILIENDYREFNQKKKKKIYRLNITPTKKSLPPYGMATIVSQLLAKIKTKLYEKRIINNFIEFNF